VTGPALLPDWQQLEKAIPQITGSMRRYLEQGRLRAAAR
jgi:hypothetical protein